MKGKGEFADFIEKKGAAVRLFEISLVLGEGAAKGAALVSEQFTFGEIFRKGSAIYRDPRLLITPAAAMEATRHKFHDMASAEKAMVVGFHFSFPSIGHVEKDGNKYRLVPIAWNPVI